MGTLGTIGIILIALGVISGQRQAERRLRELEKAAAARRGKAA